MEYGRKFEVKQYTFEGIIDKIPTLNRKEFVKIPDVAIESIVWEFYANVPDAIDNKATVRGVLILFGLSDINTFYGLRDVGQGKYESYLDNVDYKKQ